MRNAGDPGGAAQQPGAACGRQLTLFALVQTWQGASVRDGYGHLWAWGGPRVDKTRRCTKSFKVVLNRSRLSAKVNIRQKSGPLQLIAFE